MIIIIIILRKGKNPLYCILCGRMCITHQIVLFSILFKNNKRRRCAIFCKKTTRLWSGTTNSRCRSLTATTSGSDSTTSAVFVQK